MGQILHETATTTHAIREKIQNAEESLVKLTKRGCSLAHRYLYLPLSG